MCFDRTQWSAWTSRTTATLPGRSRTITVEPLEAPAPVEEPERAEPAPERDPEPDRRPAEEPVPAH